MSMRSYWCEKAYGLKPGDIAPWKLPRDKHATISVITHRQKDFATVEEYLLNCEQQFKVDYIRRLNCSAEQAWSNAMKSMNAQFNKRKRNVVLECLQFGGNKEFWDDFPDEEEIEAYFHKCYAYAVNKIGFLGMDENVICAVIITEPNRRNLFVYYLPITEKWQTKVMSNRKNIHGSKLQQTDKNGEPLYRDRLNVDKPLLCHSEFWKQRGGLTSYSDLQEDFYTKISKRYGAKRGESTSLIMNTNEDQKIRFCRFKDDEYDQYDKDYFDDSPF
ncbi:MAG: plasmid recombination protein [Corallococcus sp.]|nr:plasmid recombination protein [Corallococcus sp.]MCM1359053.1 plasmid recombination protein [Corallococcus sp.]MCM1395042.1 plasmid recombination protein [Corallococcus sp.]